MPAHPLPLLAALAWLAGCAAAPQQEPTLWTRLGGQPVVVSVIEETIDRSASDPRTKRSFEA
jgi:hypothetical protein